MKTGKLPDGWKTVEMGELFTTDQIEFIVACYNKHNGDQTAVRRELLPYFQGFRKQLEAKGLLPEYAAYAVPFWINEAKKNERN